MNVADLSDVSPVGREAASVVSGATVSTVHVREAGDGSSLPATSRALTVNVCGPRPRPVYVFGEPHATWAPSSEQMNDPDSLEMNPDCAEVVATVPLGPPVKLVSGAALSTVHCHVEMDDLLPLRSTARTSKV